MRLKAALTGLVVFGFLLLALWPWLLGNPPVRPNPSLTHLKPAQIERQFRDQQVRYVTRSAFYISTLLITFFGSTVCAWLLVRQARNEFLNRSADNLQHLIEGTLKDHEKRKG